MEKCKAKISLFIVLLVLSPLIFIQSVSADGMNHIYDPDMHLWDLVNEAQQLTAINYENGFQKMILSVDFSEMRGEKAVWIFPVPAKPDKIGIDIMKGFPRLWGYDVKERTDDTISETFSVMKCSQISTYPFMIFLYSGARRPGSKCIEKGITIHERIKEMNLTT